MMGNMFDASGSNGAGMAGMQKLMQAKMLEEMFGMTVKPEPIDMAGEMVGSDPQGSFGVMGIRLMPATIAFPVPQLTLETNGRLMIRPSDLKRCEGFFARVREQFSNQYEEASEAAKGLEGYEMFAAMLGVDTAQKAGV